MLSGGLFIASQNLYIVHSRNHFFSDDMVVGYRNSSISRCFNFCMLANFSCFCCRLLTFFKMNLFKKFFQEHYQSVKRLGFRSGPMFCRWSVRLGIKGMLVRTSNRQSFFVVSLSKSIYPLLSTGSTK